MRRIFIAWAVSFAALLPGNATPETNALIEGIDQFTLDLYKAISPAPGNLIVSPFSLSNALAIPYAGARQRTAQEMGMVLYYPRITSSALAKAFDGLVEYLTAEKADGQELHLASGLWVQEDLPLTKSFKALMEEDFKGNFQEVNFKMPKMARREINGWVKEQTGGKITDLMLEGGVTPSDRMVSISALYLRADWTFPFDTRKTKEGLFWINPSQQVKADLMHSQMRLPHFSSDRLEAIALPYEGGGDGVQLAMLVLVPKVGGMKGFEQEVSLDQLKGILEEMKLQEVAVTLPKFRMSTRLYAKDILENLGMTAAFSREADFSGIDGSQGLMLNAAVHQAYIDVDEYGTEASSASAVSAGLKSQPPKEADVEFVADHPFMVLILDAGSGQILFIGRVDNPSSEL